MKIKILILALFSVLTISAKEINRTYFINDSIITSVTNDTTLVLDHPNAQDSMIVVDVVKGVVSITTVFVNKPILRQLLNSEYFYGGIVAIILGIWRKIELRRLRKKGRYYRKNDLRKVQ